ncbi:PREDICTED: interferon-induced very large GTPase 1-like [Acropora digitifera]|uniref:interferon-induced very large GTPase 1-like n=1 Tax=Acropora digitifera TaxID=70779 RepID=UPI00077A1F5C|nr:PREDICTED: interferon-induced very large GTPase 1-like [Acropora digitifera]
MTPDELKKKISDLPVDKPTECEELIRQLYAQISTLHNTSDKEKLVEELKAVAYYGLQTDLRKMMQEKRLRLESLNLVLKHFTTVPELAEYFHKNASDSQEEHGLQNIRRRLGPDIEVLGGLSAAGIEVTKDWVKNLCKKAPSLLALPRLSMSVLENCCKGAEDGEMSEVYRLIEYAESQRSQLADIPQDKRFIQEEKDSKASDKEKLEKAKKLINEAKVMAKDQSEVAKTTVKTKLSKILSELDLPQNWLKQELPPEELLKQLDYISRECSHVLESGESYESQAEIVAKASGGKAACGIYYSHYDATRPAQMPLFLLPREVNFSNPGKSQEIKYLKFSKQGMASEYARMVESSSTSVGVGLSGFYGSFAGDFQGGYGHDQHAQLDQTQSSSQTSVSVLQFIRTAKKTFRIDPYQSVISLTARKMAKSITNDASDTETEESARFFLKRYGSHYPGGIQTLGGVFFSIADAESKSTKDTLHLTKAAVDHLNSQINAGFLGGVSGIGASATAEHTESQGQIRGRQTSSDSDSFTYSIQSVGPQATNRATFHKLLSYNSTWALIDRGESQSYIPVWELLGSLGGEYKEVSEVLKETWMKDEAMRKEKWKEENKKKRASEERAQQQETREKQLTDAKEELVKLKNKSAYKGYSPTNGKLLFSEDSLSRKSAYDKAIQFIMQDPEHNICEIIWWLTEGHTLQCWTFSNTTPTTFSHRGGEHFLFFSEMLFKWKDHVRHGLPRRMPTWQVTPSKIQPTNDEYNSYRGYSPKEGTLVSSEDSMSHKDTCDEAIQFIMKDPEHNICEITWWFFWGYTLKCWTLSGTTPTTFSHRGGDHFLLFNKVLFKWKDQMPCVPC